MRIYPCAFEEVPRGFGESTNDTEKFDHCVVPQNEQLIPQCCSCLRRSLSTSGYGRGWRRLVGRSAVASSERLETISLARACARTLPLFQRGPVARPGAQSAWVVKFLAPRNFLHSIEENGVLTEVLPGWTRLLLSTGTGQGPGHEVLGGIVTLVQLFIYMDTGGIANENIIESSGTQRCFLFVKFSFPRLGAIGPWLILRLHRGSNVSGTDQKILGSCGWRLW